MIVAGFVVDVQDADKALQDEQTKRKEREMEDLIKHELKMEKMQEQIDELEESEARLLKERNAEKLRADNTLKAPCRTASHPRDSDHPFCVAGVRGVHAKREPEDGGG